jgi:phage baseplate assembly protein gpV
VVMDSFDPIDTVAWCRVATPMAGVLHGTYFIPSPGDEVLVAFENGDLHSPIIVGSVHNATNLPPVPYPAAQIRAIRTPLGNQLVFNEAVGTVALQAGPTPPVAMPAPYSSVSLTPGNVTVSSPGPVVLTSATSIAFQVGDSVITLTPAGITITGKVIAMQGNGPIAINAPIVKIN